MGGRIQGLAFLCGMRYKGDMPTRGHIFVAVCMVTLLPKWDQSNVTG